MSRSARKAAVVALALLLLIPTETAAVCSRNPATSASERRVGSRTTVSVWNEETCNVGISSAESIDRITSRIDPSVATTRTIPRR